MSGEIDNSAIFKDSRQRFLALIVEDAKTCVGGQSLMELIRRDAEQVKAAGGGLVDNSQWPGFCHDAWEIFFNQAAVVI